MPSVILYYGPYEAYGIIKHRTQRLHGLLQYLSEQKYLVEIIPSEHPNRLTVEMEGSTIFRCDIRFLLFNIDYQDDTVCQRAIAAIEEAASRIYDDNNIPTYVSMSEGRRYIEKSKKLTTRQCFSPSVDLMYEHQEQFKDRMKAEAESLAGPDMRMTSQVSMTEMEEEGEEDYAFDEYADWDYASTLIRGILDTLPMESESTFEQYPEENPHAKVGFPFSGLDAQMSESQSSEDGENMEGEEGQTVAETEGQYDEEIEEPEDDDYAEDEPVYSA